jgi:hypothetical protein
LWFISRSAPRRREQWGNWCDHARMAEDAAVAQARVLLRSLYEHVNYVSQQIVKAERQIDRHANLAAPRHHRRLRAMRKELDEAHRLISGLHGCYPATRETSGGTAY